MENAQSAQDVAKALNNHTDQLKKILPRLEKLGDKYPELEDKDTFPEELKTVQEKMEKTSQNYARAMMKISPYMNDPAVQKAMEYMNKNS